MENKEMRAVYAQTLIDMAAKDPNIVLLEADLMKATGTADFQKVYPERLINVGIAEANMVGVAAGLSATGKIPFAATFACFASRRVFDQFFLSANYAQLRVKLVGTDPGVTAAFNGGTHMPFEDIGMMRLVPGLTIIEPSDQVSCQAMVRLAAQHPGCVYIRLHRKAVPILYPEGEVFQFGKAKLLREGSDISFIALGSLMVNECLKAADILGKEGVKASVLDVLSLKPLDSQLILAETKKTGRVVTAENAQVACGLGSAVAELLAESGQVGNVAFRRVGIQDLFGEVGTLEYLMERFSLRAQDIVAKAREIL